MFPASRLMRNRCCERDIDVLNEWLFKDAPGEKWRDWLGRKLMHPARQLSGQIKANRENMAVRTIAEQTQKRDTHPLAKKAKSFALNLWLYS